MSKVAFRSRQLDFHKPVPIYWSEELAELSDPSVVTRAIPYIPSGMEKEEESEQHLQLALSAQEKLGTTADSVIPIPEIDVLSQEEYQKSYTKEFKITKHLIRIQTFGAETEFPDYDLDTDDEKWLAENGSRHDLTPIQFESMIDRLEKGCGQQVVQLTEAKALLKEDDDLTALVYNYWLAKRVKLHHPLILHVKTDKRDGLSVNDPYVAFRRRAEKMQTRKNRKSDELSYERMVKLRRDCGKLVTLLELLRRREKSKKELIQLAREIFGKRYELNDFDGRIAMEAEAQRLKDRRPAYMTPKFLNNHNPKAGNNRRNQEMKVQKRHLSNAENVRQNKRQRIRENGVIPASAIPDDMQLSHLRKISQIEHQPQFSKETDSSSAQPQPKQLLPPVPEGRFAFKRMAGAFYLAPHPLRSRLEPPPPSNGESTFNSRLHFSRHGPRARFALTSCHTDPSQPPAAASVGDESEPPTISCLGFGRLRRGRGGASRMVIDRAPPNRWSSTLNSISDWHSIEPDAGRLVQSYKAYLQNNKIPHYCQKRDTSSVSESSMSHSAFSRVPLLHPKLEVTVNGHQQLTVATTGPSTSTSRSSCGGPGSPHGSGHHHHSAEVPPSLKKGDEPSLVFPTPTFTRLPPPSTGRSASSSASPVAKAVTPAPVPSPSLPHPPHPPPNPPSQQQQQQQQPQQQQLEQQPQLQQQKHAVSEAVDSDPVPPPLSPESNLPSAPQLSQQPQPVAIVTS